MMRNETTKTILQLVLMAGMLPLQAQEPAKKAPKASDSKQSFEYRFDDSLQQTADSLARQDLWFRDAKLGALIHFCVESPDSVSSSFGYKTKGDCYYHTEEEMIHRFVHTVCAGGNALINNGPMGNGKLDPEAVRIYGAMGKWLKVNGESIYGTVRNPLDERPDGGDISASKDGKTAYLHILEWRESGSITVNGLGTAVTSAVYLTNGANADFVQKGDTLELTLPAEPLNEYDTVVKVTF